MFPLKITQHFPILMSPYWLRYHGSCKLLNTDFPGTTPRSLVTSTRQIWKDPPPLIAHCGTTLNPFFPTSSSHFTLYYMCLTLSGVTVNSVDPGVVYTKIMRHFSWPYHFLFWLLSFFFKVGSGGWGRALLLSVLYSSSSPVSLQDSKQGAIPVLYLCLAKELDGISGKHFNSSCVITLPPEAARDCHVAQSLWNTSVRLTNLDKVDWSSVTPALTSYPLLDSQPLLWLCLLFAGSKDQSLCPV